MNEVLSYLRGLDLAPGSNVRTAAAGAGWVFTLPTLELRGVVCLGAPTAPALRRLRLLADEVVVLDHDHRRRGAVGSRLPASIDLVVDAGDRASRRLLRVPQVVDDVRAALAPGAHLYAEGIRRQPSRWASTLGLTEFCEHWVTPLVGEVRTAVPASAQAVARWLRDADLDETSADDAVLVAMRRRLRSPRRGKAGAVGGPPTEGPSVRRAGRALRGAFGHLGRVEQAVVGAGIVGRYGRVHGPSAGSPPRYVREVAAEAGVDVSEYQAALVVPGSFETQKVLAFLFPPGAEAPAFVAKIARSERVSERLDNAHSALRALEAVPGLSEQSVPRPAFFGHHRQLAVLGEAVVDGIPFQDCSSASVDCPIAAGAVSWLTELATSTARPRSGREVADGVAEVVTRTALTYDLAADHRRVLDDALEVLCSTPHLPSVLQHGDPGTWNIVVRPGGQVVFLDWENGERAGVPLWDLFTFLRSYAVLHGRAGGFTRDTAPVAFLADSPLASLVRPAVAGYLTQLGIEPAAARALFFTCWTATALREAARLHPADLGRGHHLRFLRTVLDGRDAPGLASLFEGPA